MNLEEQKRMMLKSAGITFTLLMIPICSLVYANMFLGMPMHELILGFINWAIVSIPLFGVIWGLMWLIKKIRERLSSILH